MDRLICGDVGFGKTEIAMRAAFKAAAAGKQVLMLVPTTILAQQHLATFRERFGDLPVSVDMVNRFRTPGRDPRGPRALPRRPARHPDRHPPPAVDGRAAQGPGPGDRGRGAALRRGPEGGPAPAAPARGRAGHERHAHPADAPDLAVGAARHQRHRDPAARAGGRSPPTSASTTSRWSSRRCGARPRAEARASTCTTAWRRSRRPPRGCARWLPSCDRDRPRPDGASTSSRT